MDHHPLLHHTTITARSAELIPLAAITVVSPLRLEDSPVVAEADPFPEVQSEVAEVTPEVAEDIAVNPYTLNVAPIHVGSNS